MLHSIYHHNPVYKVLANPFLTTVQACWICIPGHEIPIPTSMCRVLLGNTGDRHFHAAEPMVMRLMRSPPPTETLPYISHPLWRRSSRHCCNNAFCNNSSPTVRGAIPLASVKCLRGWESWCKNVTSFVPATSGQCFSHQKSHPGMSLQSQ